MIEITINNGDIKVVAKGTKRDLRAECLDAMYAILGVASELDKEVDKERLLKVLYISEKILLLPQSISLHPFIDVKITDESHENEVVEE